MTRPQPFGVRQAASASLWAAVELLFRQGFQFVVSVILARLLAPEVFGVVVLLSFFTGLSNVFVQGLTLGLVQAADTTADEESAAFWTNMIAAALFSAVLLAAAGAIARFYGQPVLAPLMVAAVLQIVITALGAVHSALLTRALEARKLMKVGVVSSIAAGIAGIGAALAGYGVWALALQGITAAALTSGLLWAVHPWRPALRWRLGALGRLWKFGSWISLSTLLEVIYTQGFALLLGKFYGVREVGFFSRAGATAQLPANILTMLVTRLALPLFSARSDDAAAVRRGARMANGMAMLVNLPAMAGLSLLAPDIIVLLFGERWLPSAAILAILAAGAAVAPMHVINLQIILARGESNLYFRLEIIKKVIGVICLLGGSFFGIYALAWSGVLFAFIAIGINAYPNRRAIGYGVFRQMADLKGLLPPTLAMCAAVILARWLLHWPSIAEVPALILIGAGAYVLSGFALRIALFDDARMIGADLLRGRRAAVA